MHNADIETTSYSHTTIHREAENTHKHILNSHTKNKTKSRSESSLNCQCLLQKEIHRQVMGNSLVE